jgi:hypothetical protein
MDEEGYRARLLELVREAERPLDIKFIAEKLGLTWWPTYKLVTETIIEELHRHPEVLRDLPFILLKSTKSLVIIPRKILPRGSEEETRDGGV